MQGDAAGALLVERADRRTDGLYLLDAAVRHVPKEVGRCTEVVVPEAWTFSLLSIIDFLLARHALRCDEIDEIVGQPGMTSLADAVSEHFGQPNARAQHDVGIHLGAADSIVRLAQTLNRTASPRARRTLLWGYGIGGFVGTALLGANGVPSLCQHGEVRPAS